MQERVYEIRRRDAIDLSKLRWSGNMPLPEIGQRVKSRMNGLGHGTVRAYFVEDGWVGVYVWLETPPAWWVAQQRTKVPAFGRIAGCAMLFGIEIAPLAALAPFVCPVSGMVVAFDPSYTVNDTPGLMALVGMTMVPTMTWEGGN